MKLASILDALRSGAVLHFGLAERPRWELYETGAITTVSSTQAQSLLKRGAIAAAGDSLFPEVPSQTWRYSSAYVLHVKRAIHRELKRAFPGVKFSLLKRETGIEIFWSGGPGISVVETIAKKHGVQLSITRWQRCPKCGQLVNCTEPTPADEVISCAVCNYNGDAP
jgi:hypothetical protein